MSWYSDGEKFNEYDPPWCENCTRGNSYEECKRCSEMHTERYSEDGDWLDRRENEGKSDGDPR